jgi:hypothetical protein
MRTGARTVTKWIGGIVLVMTLAACATPSQPGGAGGPNTVIQVEANREFEISAGQEAHIQGTPIVVRFRSVSNDSRCPSDVQCVWAGNAVVGLTLSQGDGPTTDASLNTTLEPRLLKFGGHTIKLVGLKPGRQSSKPIPDGAYVATLEVSPE